MPEPTTTRDDLRTEAAALLSSVGVSRIVVVDDEYAFDVEYLLGICSELAAPDAAALPHLGDVDFRDPYLVWTRGVRDVWRSLEDTARHGLLVKARARQAASADRTADGESDDAQEAGDFRAATSLEEVLGDLSECEFITLSLAKWEERSEELLTDEKAASMLLFFDRDFSREREGATEEGLRLLLSVQSRDVRYCGLISHNFSVGGEYEAWDSLSNEYGLMRDKFLVIAKERLKGDRADEYGFLGMLRLAALSSRYARVKSMAWSLFDDSVEAAKGALDRLSILDFDRIVFESSRREGVWEPDTLFRVFSILIRRDARAQMHGDGDLFDAIAEARRVSAVPESIAHAFGNEVISQEAVRIQRFETYDGGEELNAIHAPLELGDVFENASTGRRYILLVQPCDLMVRPDGTRSHDGKLGRMGTMVELVLGGAKEKDWWGDLPFYDERTGKSAFANFARAHQVRLAVLDLCVIGTDGVAEVGVHSACPELVIEPWRARFARLQKFFRGVLDGYGQLDKKQVGKRLRALALPRLSTTLSVAATANSQTVRYDFKRVLRLRQPWSAALFTAYAQYLARTAFEHPLEHRIDVAVNTDGDTDAQEDEPLGNATAVQAGTEDGRAYRKLFGRLVHWMRWTGIGRDGGV